MELRARVALQCFSCAVSSTSRVEACQLAKNLNVRSTLSGELMTEAKLGRKFPRGSEARQRSLGAMDKATLLIIAHFWVS